MARMLSSASRYLVISWAVLILDGRDYAFLGCGCCSLGPMVMGCMLQYCKKWFHRQCVGLTKAAYEALTATPR